MCIFSRIYALVAAAEATEHYQSRAKRKAEAKVGPTGGRKHGKRKRRKEQKAARRGNRR